MIRTSYEGNCAIVSQNHISKRPMMNFTTLFQRLEHSINAIPILIATIYTVIAALWIIGTGQLMSQLKDPDLIHDIERIKGLAFVLTTALILFLLLRSWNRRIQTSHEQLKTTLDTIPDLLFEVDLQGRYYDYHSPRTDLLAAPPETLIGKTVEDFLPKEAAAVCLEALQEAHFKGSSNGKQFELLLNNEIKWFELSISPKSSIPHKEPRFIVLSRDITKRKSDEQKIIRLSHLYAALSQSNQTIIHSRNEDELFATICRDAVEYGNMKMAWIGLADNNAETLRPVAFYGDGTDYLNHLKISLRADDLSGKGPSGTVFREDRPFWCQDFQHHPATSMWHQQGARFGWGSSAAIPLHLNAKVIGTLNLYASESNAFDDVVQKLIIQMGRDIDYALQNFENDRHRQRIENELLKRSQAMGQTSNSIIITDFKGNIEYVNTAFVRTTGYSAQEVIGKNPRILKSGKTLPHAYDEMWKAITNGQSWQGEFINKRKDGVEYIYSINVSPVVDDDSRITHYIAIEEDITERKKTEERVHFLANFDVLTGLPNRARMEEHFSYILSLARRNNTSFALMFLDLDHFKDINDSLGHKIGDELLVQLSKRLQSVLREEDTLSRQGGDEFILLLPGANSHGASTIAQKLIETVAKPFSVNEYELSVTISIGISLFPNDGDSIETLAKNADAAMYRAKQEGRNSFRFFTEELQQRTIRNLELSNALHYAIENKELYLTYQPQIASSDRRIIGAEALIRWNHPLFGHVSPSEFIPIAEDNGLILPIGEWVLRTAIAQAKQWIDLGLSPMIMAVNLSAVQFRHPHLPLLISSILQEVQLPPEYLEIELTERMAMHDPDRAVLIMNQLHQQGIRMSIDDFGTGYSSLSYLKKFNVYKLKIDQSFVRDINTDAEDKAIVRAIIDMAKGLGLLTIAEGVETQSQLAFLQQQGCDEIQGYLFSKPLLPEAFETFIRTHQLGSKL